MNELKGWDLKFSKFSILQFFELEQAHVSSFHSQPGKNKKNIRRCLLSTSVHIPVDLYGVSAKQRSIEITGIHEISTKLQGYTCNYSIEEKRNFKFINFKLHKKILAVKAMQVKRQTEMREFPHPCIFKQVMREKYIASNHRNGSKL